jgi:CubicO group peptidase (beta-lactamase class C family)
MHTLAQTVHGTVAPGFESVSDEFATNLLDRGELGAACAVYYRGELVVDLCGGSRDKDSALLWEEDTLVCVFSTTKGLAAMAMAVAHTRGLWQLDEPVATYWPEFAQAGKDRITMRQLLSHQAGLSAIATPLDSATIADPDALAAVLAEQTPAWPPGTWHGYHALSLGWYQSEILRRVDPRRRTLGQYFHEEVAQPLNLEFYIGLPATIPQSRVAVLQDVHPANTLWHLNAVPWRFVFAMFNPWSQARRTFSNPKLNNPADISRGAYRSLEIPSANGFGCVRSIAKAYSELATGGTTLGLHARTIEELTATPPSPRSGTRDVVLGAKCRYACGFSKPSPDFSFGSSSRSFGAPGMGGSFGFADPDRQIGYAYAPNRLGYYLWDDPREKALRKTCYTCIDQLEGRSR